MPDTEYTEESISDVGQKMEDFFEDMKVRELMDRRQVDEMTR